MAASSEIVNAATTNGLDRFTHSQASYIQFMSWSCNWAFLRSESALIILLVMRGLINYIEIAMVNN